MLIYIDCGDRVKINSITFLDNDELSDGILRRQFKNTKRKFFGRFWKKSKFIEDDYDQDLNNLIDFYKEKGNEESRCKLQEIAFV